MDYRLKSYMHAIVFRRRIEEPIKSTDFIQNRAEFLFKVILNETQLVETSIWTEIYGIPKTLLLILSRSSNTVKLFQFSRVSPIQCCFPLGPNKNIKLGTRKRKDGNHLVCLFFAVYSTCYARWLFI